MISVQGWLNFFSYFVSNVQDVCITTAVCLCTTVVFLGCIKGLFDYIKIKQARRAALALSSLVCLFPVYGVAFWFARVSYEYYLYWVICSMPLVVIVYWVYEVTALRDLVDKIGKNTLKRFLVFLCADVVDTENKNAKEKLIAEDKEIKDYTKIQIKSALATRNKDEELDEI